MQGKDTILSTFHQCYPQFLTTTPIYVREAIKLGENIDNLGILTQPTKETELTDYKTDYERAEYLQRLLINACTDDGPTNEEHYKYLRSYFLSNEGTKDKLPSWVRTNRDLKQFWQFIKHKISTYAERRQFIWNEFNEMMEYLESIQETPHVDIVNDKLKVLNSDYIMGIWQKALKRKISDPDGAITISRTLIESVLKHILDELNIAYSNDMDIHELYKMVANKLNMAPEQHHEKVFKQILGGCSAIVNGLGSLRNSLGDAHGKGKKLYKPSERHAELAVNLAGSMCLFLLQTYKWNKENGLLSNHC